VVKNCKLTSDLVGLGEYNIWGILSTKKEGIMIIVPPESEIIKTSITFAHGEFLLLLEIPYGRILGVEYSKKRPFLKDKNCMFSFPKF